MLRRLMSRLAEAGQRERDRMQGKPGAAGLELSPWRMLGGWFSFLRPHRLLKLLGGCAVLAALFYVIEFRSAAAWAETEAGAGASAARIEALTIERLALTSCPGTRRACGVLPGKQTLYRSFGAVGMASMFVLAGAGFFLLGWGLARRQ
jgi:hypothetical protein